MTTNIAISNCAVDATTAPPGKTDVLPNTSIIRAGVTTNSPTLTQNIDNFGDATTVVPTGSFCTVNELIWAVRMAVEGRAYGTPPVDAGGKVTLANGGSRGDFTHSYKPANGGALVDVDSDSFGPFKADITNPAGGPIAGYVGWTGWTLYDTFPLTGDNDPSGIVTQVYRALNKDGVSYKYSIFRWNLLLSEINITSCEAWDKVTRTSTNETHTFFDSSPIPYKLNETKLVLMINPRWLVLQSIIYDEPSVWAGVFETAREDITDVATSTNPGLPCWGWISSTLWSLGAKSYLEKPMGGGAGATGTATASDYTLLSMPRTKSGATGFGAAKGWGADYGVAQYPNWLTSTTPAFVTYLSNDNVGNKFQANSWDTTKRLVLPIKPIHDYAANFVANYGTIFGLKVLAPIGPMMTKIKVNTDADGNYTPVVTSTSTKIHWLLNTHHKASGGAVASGSDSNSWFQNTQLGITNINTSPNKPFALVNVGSICYAIAVAGGQLNKFLKINLVTQQVDVIFDLLTSSASKITIPTLSPADITDLGLATGNETAVPTLFFDIKYDGDQYIYLTTDVGLIRYRITDGKWVNRNKVGPGCQAISLTASKIYVAPKTASPAPKIYSLNRADFSWQPQSTDILLTDFTDDVIMTDACTGTDGSVYFTPVIPATSNGYSTRYRLIKIDPAGVVSYHPFTVGTGNLATRQAALQVLDSNNLLLWQATGDGGACTLYAVRINTTKMTMMKSIDTIQSTGIALAGAGIISSKRIQHAKIQGVIIAAPYYVTTIGSYATLQLCSQSTSNTLGVLSAVAGLNGVVNITDTISPAGNNLFVWDGVRFYGNTDSSLHIFSKLNNESCFSDGSKNILLGQVTLPA
jgi:hypothetical protein